MGRKQEAEEKWRERFDDLGLSDRFSLMGRDWSSDHGRKAFVKCKACGAEFHTWAVAEVFKGRQSHIVCPECGAASDGLDMWTRSPIADAVEDFYVQGHTVKETATAFGLHEHQINGFVKARRITNGREFRSQSEETKRLRKNEKEEAAQRLAENLVAHGFDYIGGYDGVASTIEIRCKTCGKVYTRTACRAKTGKVVCRNCKHKKTLARQEERKRADTIKKLERANLKKQTPKKDPYKEIHEAFLDRTGICEICGKPYTVREYVERCGLKKAADNGVCSPECRDEKKRISAKNSHKGRNDGHRARAKRFRSQYDPGVTLKKLIERDGLTCAICGKPCDPNDRSWSKYSGPLSPSIDHIIPMAKGGGHVWGNVQVAHIICNSKKGAG